MNNISNIDIIMLLGYLSLTLLVSIYISRQSINTIESYYISKRNSSWWLLGTSMVATTLSIDTPIVVIGWIYSPGLWKNWFWWSFLFTHSLVIFYFSRYWRRIGVLTDNELIQYRYSGLEAKFLRYFKAFYFSIFFNLIISAWIISAFLKIFGIIIGDYSIALLLLSTLIAIFYTTLSGIKGVMINDFIQYFIAFAGSIVLAIFIINSDAIGGLENYFIMAQELPNEKTSFVPQIFNFEDFLTFLAYVSIVWWTSHNADGGGYIIQRLCTARSEKDGVLGTIWFVLNHYVLRLIPWLFIGFSSLIIFNSSKDIDPESIFPIMINDYLGSGFMGLILISLVAAYMSTISTQVNWGSSYFVNDIYKIIKPDTNQKHLVFVGRLFSIIFLMSAVFLGLAIDNIGKVWIFLWSVSSGLGFFLIARWFYWRINAWSEISAILSSIILSSTFFILDFFNVYELSFLNKLVIIPISIFVGFIFTFVTKPTQIDILRDFYNKVLPDGYWGIFKKDSKKNKNSNLIDSLVFSTSLVSLLFSIICLSLGNFKIFTLSFCIGLIMLIYILRKIIL